MNKEQHTIYILEDIKNRIKHRIDLHKTDMVNSVENCNYTESQNSILRIKECEFWLADIHSSILFWQNKLYEKEE